MILKTAALNNLNNYQKAKNKRPGLLASELPVRNRQVASYPGQAFVYFQGCRRPGRA